MLLGLSHHCYIVTAVNLDSQKSAKYFVKSLSSHPSTEQNERLVAQSAAALNLSPSVIYQSKDWLVTQYIEGYSLFENQYTISEKIAVSMRLLQNFHQVTPMDKISSQSIKSLIEAQIKMNAFTQAQQSFLMTLNQKINTFAQVSEPVVCHGDLNFTNILIDKRANAWLVDYECTSIGCAEYDVAMFIAINNLSNCDFAYIFDCYQGKSKKSLKADLVHAYLACCYLINGLWYQERSYHTRENDQYIDLAHQQYSQFDRLNLTDKKLVEQLL